MMKRFVLTILLLLLGNAAFAQTVAKSFEWDTTDPLVTVNTYVNTLAIDAVPAATITATCATVGTLTHCKTPVQLTPGTHTLTLVITNVNGLTATGTLNYNPGAPPATPSGTKIVVIITVP